ncbi:MAG TPA: ribonuclease HII [Patescibacteria group bacterium]|nr:ribonuclease HII [Patescibacteria group bacterium]
MKSFPDYTYEAEALSLSFTHPVGIDEVGRGCGAGPVVAAAVYIPPNTMAQFIGRVTDSKQLTEAKRVELARELSTTCDIGVGVIDQKIIDDVNILEATKLAMKVALYDLDIPYDYIFIDGPIKLKSIAATQCPIIKGDSKVLSIAAASIVAKVVRDHLMYEYDKNFPLYKWRKNKGYLTKDHREAIITYGPCEYHRKSFKGVKEYA